jgi:hypothetical protein
VPPDPQNVRPQVAQLVVTEVERLEPGKLTDFRRNADQLGILGNSCGVARELEHAGAGSPRTLWCLLNYDAGPALGC